MEPFTRRAVEWISKIPEGKVMTYGQIAALAGSKRGARQVVRILHSMSASHHLPWHRVVNAKGEIAIKDDASQFIQKQELEQEGVTFDQDDRIDLTRFQYIP